MDPPRPLRSGDGLFSAAGLVGPAIALASVIAAIAFSPWFSWSRNALSDLGHAVRSSVAPLFNLGLALGGALLLVYSVTSLYRRTRATWLLLASSAFFLVLIAVFDEVYGYIHFIASVLFFVTATASALSFYIEKGSSIALVGFLISAIAWVCFYLRRSLGIETAVGVAVPEFISAVSVSTWIIWESLLDLVRSR